MHHARNLNLLCHPRPSALRAPRFTRARLACKPAAGRRHGAAPGGGRRAGLCCGLYAEAPYSWLPGNICPGSCLEGPDICGAQGSCKIVGPAHFRCICNAGIHGAFCDTATHECASSPCLVRPARSR
jgi:hypothetical protein